MNSLSSNPLPSYLAHSGDVVRDRDEVLSIWRGNLGREDRIAAKYDWLYLACPYGAPLLQLLRHEPSGSWVGTACAAQKRMQWNGSRIRAGVLIDLAVVPDHRSLGPAMILQQGVIEAGKRQLDLLYGFPNPKAAVVFKRSGYEKLTDMVRYACVLRHARYLHRKVPNWLATPLGAVADIVFGLRARYRRMRGPRHHAKWSECADSRMDVLWAGSTRSDGPLTVRDYTYARWRFDDSPLERIRYLMIAKAAEGDLLAWFATHADAGTLHVRDFWSINGPGISEACINALLCAARNAGYSAVSVEIAAAETHTRAWKNCSFVARGSRPVFGRWSNPDPTRSTSGIFLTFADEDE